jgi:UDP-N-acetylglucosamine 1-carboxyvinyltransferase
MENSSYIHVTKSPRLSGSLSVAGAKNASMVIMIATLLTRGVSRFYNVPALIDVFEIIALLKSLGAHIVYDAAHQVVTVDTTHADGFFVDAARMKKTRASILVLGPLLQRTKKACLGLPGGDLIGARPIDLHTLNLQKMGAAIEYQDGCVTASATVLQGQRLTLAYPSVGATENILMAAVCAQGCTTIVNAALEPEVLDLIDVLKKMGARITIAAPATIIIDGVSQLFPVEHTIISDRLEAGAVLIAAAMTGGDIFIPNIKAHMLDVVLLKLEEMGNTITIGNGGLGVRLQAAPIAQATSLKTGPYPNFATDLQSPIMAALVCAQGISVIEETVFENRLQHVAPLVAMGALITISHSNKAIITGVSELYGTQVQATDIRSSCALVLAGLIAQGTTQVFGVHQWKRGFDNLEHKLCQLGALITIVEDAVPVSCPEVVEAIAQ